MAISSLIILTLATLLISTAHAQSAPAPGPSGPINITAILEKAGQYTFFIRMLNQSQAGNQINIQVNNSHDGMTVFAPTDNAFQNLPSGALNNLTDQQQVQLVLYHITPKFYTLETLTTVSNPVRTEASGQDGKVFGLYFSGGANQVNVSTGVVECPIYNALWLDFPLAVYQVDKVLLPKEFYEASPPVSSSVIPPVSSPVSPPVSSSVIPPVSSPVIPPVSSPVSPPVSSPVVPPVSSAPPPKSGGNSSGAVSDGTAPAPHNPKGNGSGKMTVGLGLVSAIFLVCFGLLF